MNIEKIIRNLAKKTEIINLFVASKDLNGINLFKNNIDFSKIQRLFLSYLYFYYDIYNDIASKKINKSIIKDNIYEDAYMLWKEENNGEINKSKKNKVSDKKDIYLVFDNSKKEAKTNG
jgi:hypothetical protein